MTGRERARAIFGRIAPGAHRVDRWMPFILTVAFLIAVGWMTARHEMWRDEIQAWLIARDSATPLDVLRNTRYEGHPWLWHLLLWIPSRFTWNPAAMQVLHVALAGGAVFLMLRFAPFPRIVRLLLAGGYFFAYEWAVLSRNYGVSVLLFFGFAALYAYRWRNAVWLGLLLGLACLANVFSIILVLVLAPALTVEYAVAYAGGYRAARTSLLRALAGLALALAGIGAGLRAVTPPSDSGFATEWRFRWSPEHYRNAADRVIRAYLPLPEDSPGYWNSNRLLNAGRRPEAERPRWAIPDAVRARTAWLILLAGALFFYRRPWPAVPYAIGSIGLVLFHYVKYLGSMRHAGFLFLWFIVLLWMSRHLEPWRLPGRRWNCVLEWGERLQMGILALLLTLHGWAAVVAFRGDAHHPFSQAPAAAAYLQHHVPDLNERTWAGIPSPEVSAVVGHLRLPAIHYLDAERTGSFVVWDQAPRGLRNEREVIERVQALGRREGKPVIVISGHRISDRGAARGGLTALAAFEGSATGESYHLYEWRAAP